MTVLDVGCAQGSLLLELYRRCTQTELQIVPMGIEVSRDLAFEAKRGRLASGQDRILQRIGRRQSDGFMFHPLGDSLLFPGA